MKTTRQKQGAIWGILPVLLWVLIGGAFAPRHGHTVVSSLRSHVVCFCRMCNGSAKTCCCTPDPDSGQEHSHNHKSCTACDVSEDERLIVSVSFSVLPPRIAALPRLSFLLLNSVLPILPFCADSRTPVPLLTPPRRLS